MLDVDAAVAAALKRFGRLDIAVTAADISPASDKASYVTGVNVFVEVDQLTF